jgi:hypothetical protein
MNDTFHDQWTRFTQAVAEANRLNKSIVFDALSAAGITQVHVSFDGEGDSGQIEYVRADAGDTPVELPPTPVTLQSAGYGSGDLTPTETPLGEAVEVLCYGYLEQEYDGWENNDGAFGEFTFHVAERRIALDFNARFTDYCHNSHAF